MTDRKTASTINDTELDQLYDERGRLKIANRALNTAVVEAVERAELAEDAIARVRALHMPDDQGECRSCHASFDPCPTIQALDQPAPLAATQATEPQVIRRRPCSHGVTATVRRCHLCHATYSHEHGWRGGGEIVVREEKPDA